MKELQQKQRLKQIIYSTPVLLMAAIVVFFLAKGAFNILVIERQSAGVVKELEEQSSTLSLRKEELNREIKKFDTEEGIIEEIKEKFSATRQGEYVAIIVDERNRATSTEESSKTWYKKLLSAIIFWK